MINGAYTLNEQVLKEIKDLENEIKIRSKEDKIEEILVKIPEMEIPSFEKFKKELRILYGKITKIKSENKDAYNYSMCFLNHHFNKKLTLDQEISLIKLRGDIFSYWGIDKAEMNDVYKKNIYFFI